MAQARAHLFVPACLANDVCSILVSSLCTLIDATNLITNALGNRCGALVPFLAALLQGLAVGVFIKAVRNCLVLEFVAAVVIDGHACEFERCPAVFGWVCQLVLAHLALDLCL